MNDNNALLFPMFSHSCIFFTYTIKAFHGNLWAKGDHLMEETSYLKTHPLRNRYPEWTPNLHPDRSQDSNPCARGSQGTQSANGSTVPRRLSMESNAPCPPNTFHSDTSLLYISRSSFYDTMSLLLWTRWQESFDAPTHSSRQCFDCWSLSWALH